MRNFKVVVPAAVLVFSVQTGIYFLSQTKELLNLQPVPGNIIFEFKEEDKNKKNKK
jgi:hypothetical protein